jgi:hypothetical protein
MAQRSLAALIVLLSVAPAMLPAAAQCRGDQYAVVGRVVDAMGRPVRDVTVHVLLDQISKKKFAEQGVRARGFRTDGSGQFSGFIDCGEAREAGGANPCANKPKHVTVAADRSGYNLRLQVFKLKELGAQEQSGICHVRVPEIRLSGGY